MGLYSEKGSKAANDFQKRAGSFENKSRWVTDPDINAVPYTYLLRKQSLGDMLDAGGGTGYLSWFLAEKIPANSITIVDASRNMLEIAARKLPGVKLVNSSIESFCIGNEKKFDTIIARQIFHYVDDAKEVVCFLKDQLALNGMLYVGQFVVPDRASDEWHMNLIRRISHNRKRSFTLSEFKKLFEENGLEILECSTNDYEENVKDFYSRRTNGELEYDSLLSNARASVNSQVSEKLRIRNERDNLYFTVWFCHLLLVHKKR